MRLVQVAKILGMSGQQLRKELTEVNFGVKPTDREVPDNLAHGIIRFVAKKHNLRVIEDALAFLRDAPAFVNLTLAEQPNGDFGRTIVRQCLLDAWQLEMYEALLNSNDTRLASIAAKAIKETRYHFRFSSGWLVRLGDGTEESHRRVQAALEELWRFTTELFAADEVDDALAAAGVAPKLAELQPRWSARIDGVLQEATLVRPSAVPYQWHGKRGVHTEHLGHMLAEMQHLQRTYPGAQW